MSNQSNQYTDLQPGQICGFFDKECFLIGMIVAVSDKTIHVHIEDAHIYNLNQARLIIITDEIFPAENIAITLAEFTTEVRSVRNTISPDFVWLKMRADIRSMTFREIIRLCGFPETDIYRFALFLLLRECSHLFRHKGELYKALSEEDSLSILAAKEEFERELAYHKAIELWLEQVISEPNRRFDLDVTIQNTLEYELSLHPYTKPIHWLRHILRCLIPDYDYPDAVLILRKHLGQIDEKTNRLLAVSGLPVLFSAHLRQAADSIRNYVQDDSRVNLTNWQCWTIDADDTEDIDDAISLQYENGQWVLGIHISEVALFIASDTDIDSEAQRRTASIYLPDMTVHMFPESISCHKASLKADTIRPTLSLICKIGSDFEIISIRIVQSTISVNKRFSYSEFEHYLNPESEYCDIKSKVAVLHQITEKHLQTRIEYGARIVNDIEQTPARRLIAELMVIYNSQIAKFAKQNHIPFLYRYLEHEMPALLSGLAEKQAFPASILGIEPIPHQAMGLSVYAQLTSPLRRYSDLLNQRQIIALLNGKNIPYQENDLIELIPHLTQTRQLIRQITNKAERQFNNL